MNIAFSPRNAGAAGQAQTPLRARSVLPGSLSGLLLGALLAPAAVAADVFVITHPGTDISAADVREVFLGDKQFAGVVKLVPVDNTAVQSDFLTRVVKFDAAKYATAWTKKSFRDGLNPPAVRGSDAEVVAYVRQTPGAIGYVSTSPPGNVKLVQKF